MSTRRYCHGCARPLAGGDGGRLCGDCRSKRRRGRAPDVPPEFWQTEVMGAALASGDLGGVIRAYRCHPFHGQRVSQAVLADWLHMSQAAVWRMENGRQRVTIDEIAQIAQALGVSVTLRWEAEHEAGEDMDPLSRRSLLGAGAGAALSLGATTSPAPAAARDVDPELVEHWMQLMRLFELHDGVFGSRTVIDTVRHEQRQIARHRAVARGDLRATLLRVEARWSNFASWLYSEMGDREARDAAARRTLDLAHEADYPDAAAYTFQKRARWAIMDNDPRCAVALAARALDVHHATTEVRALCTLAAAQASALAGSGPASADRLREAETLLYADHNGRDELGAVVGCECEPHYVAADTARCRLWLEPAAAVTAYENVLRGWPYKHLRDGAVEQSRFALACAAANEPERAAAEGMKALDIAQTTRSNLTLRELKRLDHRLTACDLPQAADFREAFAASA